GPQTPPPGWAPQGPQTPAPGWVSPQQQQQWGQPGAYPGQFGQQQPPKRNKGVLAAVGAAGVAVLVLLGAVAYVTLKDDGPEKAAIVPPEQKSSAAATTLQSVPGLHYAGSFDAGGSTIQADLSVTRSGSATGTLTIDGDTVELMVIDGVPYIKAPRSYWRKQTGIGEVSAPAYSDRWSKAPSSLAGFDLRTKLTPANLGTGLGKAIPLVPPSGAPTAEPVDGDQAVSFEGDDYQFYVSDSAPYHLVKIKGGASQGVDLSVTELTLPQTTDVFTQLKEKAKSGLAGSLDPDARVNLVGKPASKGCKESSCTFTMKLRNSGAEGVTANVFFTITDGKRAGGKKITECRSTGQSLKSGATVTVSCRTSGGGWTKWAKNIKPGARAWYWTDVRFTVEAVTGKKVTDLVSKLDQEQQGA
ncbi:hypothetical protein, partial [Actinocorallia lasiicapitis]